VARDVEGATSCSRHDTGIGSDAAFVLTAGGLVRPSSAASEAASRATWPCTAIASPACAVVVARAWAISLATSLCRARVNRASPIAGPANGSNAATAATSA